MSISYNHYKRVQLESSYINACANEDIDTITQLISDNVELINDKPEGFIIACEKDHIDVIKLLLLKSDRKRHDIYNEGFTIACFKYDINMAKTILEYTDSIDQIIIENLFVKLCLQKQYNMTDWFLKIHPTVIYNSMNYDVIETVCKCGYIDVLDYLKENGYAVNYNVNNGRLIYTSCYQGQKDLMTYMIYNTNNVPQITYDLCYIIALNENHNDIKEWLLPHTTSIKIEALFETICNYNDIPLIKYINKIYPEYTYEIRNGKVVYCGKAAPRKKFRTF